MIPEGDPLAIARIDFLIQPVVARDASGREQIYGGEAYVNWIGGTNVSVRLSNGRSISLPREYALVAHACLHFGRMLAVMRDSQGSMQEKFYRIVRDAAFKSIDSEPEHKLSFESWSEVSVIQRQRQSLPIWPWRTYAGESPKTTPDVTYLSYLRRDHQGHLFSMIDLPFEGTKLLPPLSALVFLDSLCVNSSPKFRMLLSGHLTNMTQYYDKITYGKISKLTPKDGEFPEELALRSFHDVIFKNVPG